MTIFSGRLLVGAMVYHTRFACSPNIRTDDRHLGLDEARIEQLYFALAEREGS